jgi:hypothetical protein
MSQTAFAYDALGHLTSKDTTAAGPVSRALYDWTYNRAGYEGMGGLIVDYGIYSTILGYGGTPTNPYEAIAYLWGGWEYAYTELGEPHIWDVWQRPPSR